MNSICQQKICSKDKIPQLILLQRNIWIISLPIIIADVNWLICSPKTTFALILDVLVIESLLYCLFDCIPGLQDLSGLCASPGEQERAPGTPVFVASARCAGQGLSQYLWSEFLLQSKLKLVSRWLGNRPDASLWKWLQTSISDILNNWLFYENPGEYRI